MQTTISQNQAPAFPGMIADFSPHNVRSYSNGTLQKKKVSVTISTAADATYTIGIDGVTITYNEGATGTVTTKRDGLIAAINANTVVRNYVYASIKDADELFIEGRAAGRDFTVSEADTNIATPVLVTAAGTGQEVPFGVAVEIKESSDQLARLPAGAGGKYVGITVWSPEQQSLTVNGYPAKTPMGVMRKGVIWVKVEQAVTPEDDVFYRIAANGSLTQLGAIRKDADTANAVQITGAKFLTAAAADGLAQVLLG